MPTKYIHSTAEADDIHEQLLTETNKYNTKTQPFWPLIL